MGRQLPVLGCLLPHTKQLLSSKSTLIRSQKSLREKENGGSVVDFWWGVGVGCIHSETEMAAELSGGGDFTRHLC